MSHPVPGYGPGYGPAPVQKHRPRPRWFVIGGALLVLAATAFVVGLFTVLRPLTQEDAVISPDDGSVTVDVPAGEERALFTRSGYGTSGACLVTDEDGDRPRLRSISGDFTYNEWTAENRFDTGAGDVVVDCSAAGESVRVGQVPSTGAFVVGLLVAILGPIVLGLAGLVVLVVTGILYATRPARPRV